MVFGRWLNKFHVETEEWHPLVATACGAFLDGDWPALTTLLDLQDPDSAFRLLLALGFRVPLDHPVDLSRTDECYRLIVGSVMVCWAWHQRGFGRGHEVSDEAWALCHDRADTSLALLAPVIRARYRSGVVASFAIRAATLLGDTNALDELEEIFLASDDPTLEGGAWLIQARGRKWYGTHDQMYQVTARMASDRRFEHGRFGFQARAVTEEC